jgi:hypothetical protein
MLSVLFAGLFFSFFLSKSFASFSLVILGKTTNSITVAWPATGSYVLLTNGSLLGPWGAYGGTISSNNGTDTVTLARYATSEFFRLQSASAPGLASPTNIPGMAYYWNYNDLPQNTLIDAWTDEVSGLVMTYNNGGVGANVAPTTSNLFPGLNIPLYGGNIAFINNLAPLGSNFTFWAVIRPSLQNTLPNPIIFGNASGSGIGLSGNVLNANWGNGQIDSSMALNYLDTQDFPYGQTYDILDSGGTIYSNGVAMAQGIGQPLNNFQFDAIGSGSGYSMEGFIQYVGVWTNHLLTATDATNLDYWYWNSGVTNVTNGLIAWWKLNDGSGLVAADSWGTNTMYFGGTGNMWTNGIVGGSALYFNGNGWITNLSTSFADNLPGITVSFWVKETGLGGDNNTGSLVEKGSGAGFDASSPGWAIQGDGTSNVYFGTYQSDGTWSESPHNDSAPDNPIIGNNQWHFVLGEYTNPPGAGMNPFIYIDGAQITGGQARTGSPTNISTPFSEIIIGAENAGPTNSGSPAGAMQDVRIYNRVLSLPEIQDLYKWRGQP